MNASKEIKTIYDVVKDLLDKNPHLRDDDDKLVANIWIRECGGVEKSKTITALDFLKVYAGTTNEIKYPNEQHATIVKFTSAESITRARRKLQEENLLLRGTKYAHRNNEQEAVKEFIRKTN